MNVAEEDTPPPGPGFTTAICAVPAVDKSAELSVTFSCVALTKVVTRLLWFYCTVEPWTKPVPVMVTVVAASPAVAPVGDMEVTPGAGLFC